ncbi:hypothetical protein A2765_03365 [Candidatus Kaiserbacteria bacterium RIFCSPHIGHO2_01_FULL_56_24]|uniref:Probable membrane transporter protein n=1 Tax=Candidatus Kaiserbacteria bacterium RIFCSPHIGHO2_01_FULL_56_24 TaxID=1798487 RepID=A0A1F6DCU3_9BACT|nr:MAG: hypothetical protein A2765_03365 [Candidatus Kaiserbacteria bacterium RIFCSPHIGHO2_01_FULL_56_24]
MLILGIALLTFGTAIIGTIAGFGISTIMVPVLALGFPIPEVLLFVGIVHWLDGVWKIILFRREGLNIRLVLWFALPAAATSVLGALLTFKVPGEILLQIVGIGLIGYVAFLFARPAFRLARTARNEFVAGLVSGFLPGLVGVGGEIRSAFLSAFDLPKASFIFTSGVIALFIDTGRVATYFIGGTRLSGDFLFALMVAVPASLAGAWLAKRIANRIPQRLFRPLIGVLLLLVSIKFILFP